MTNRERCEARRGAEEETFDLLAQVWTSDQWSEMLKAPLERAARQGNRGLAQKLVRAGAEIGDALHEATRGGHGDVVSDLLENGASVDAKVPSSDDGLTPLHVAAIEGETEIVQLLLLKQADKDTMDNKECTPLHLAVLNDHVAAALALMAAGADVTLRCGGHFKRSVLHLAASRGHVDILRAAIKRGADVDTVDHYERTPLHAAASSNKVESMHVLLEAGANTEAQDDDDWTPLHHAAFDISHAAVLTLLKHGADVNTLNEDTPLHWAARMAGVRAAAEVVDSLLRSRADETILTFSRKAAADVVAECRYGECQLPEDVDRVRELLANAPADRAWRRRGYLVLCRPHPDRVQQVHESSSACAGLARTARSSAKLARTEAGSCGRGTAVGGTVDRRTGGDWAVVMVRVLALQQEGIFRTIVGYL